MSAESFSCNFRMAKCYLCLHYLMLSSFTLQSIVLDRVPSDQRLQPPVTQDSLVKMDPRLWNNQEDKSHSKQISKSTFC